MNCPQNDCDNLLLIFKNGITTKCSQLEQYLKIVFYISFLSDILVMYNLVKWLF